MTRQEEPARGDSDELIKDTYGGRSLSDCLLSVFNLKQVAIR